MHNDAADAVVAYYREFNEPARLTDGRGAVEMARMQELLRADLGSGQRVLDVGGGDGVHAEWLTADGHQVTVVDLVPEHVDAAQARGLDAQVADACDLPFDDMSFDAVLLLGPLYHLPTQKERVRALKEAYRVLRPGGLAVAVGVSRLAVLLDWMASGRLADVAARQAVQRIVQVGRDDTGSGAGVFFFHTPEDLTDELTLAGFDSVQVRAVEGPGWWALPVGCPEDDPRVADVLLAAQLADGQAGAVGVTSHLLALAHRRLPQSA